MKNSTLTQLRRQAAMMLALLCLPVMAQEELSYIDLTFAGRGESTTVESVTVTNLSRPDVAPVTLSGTDILRLADAETITPVERIAESIGIAQPILTPNPAMGDGTLIFDAKQDGPVRVGIYSTNGMLMESAVLDVQKGRNTARIPGQAPGIYIIKVEGQGLSASTRWICGGSKSFSGIALGGANQWADRSLPVRFTAPVQQSRAADANVEYMEFNEGDILRFEGKSGQMRTIMHLSPESSHDVFFDFFRCQDAAGYNYPIVRIGDMLWMLEDLRPLTMPGLIKTSNPKIWSKMDDLAAAEFVDGSRAYYTVSGARKAMPEGWQMPSIDEIQAFLKDLQADTLTLGDFLKDRSYEDWPLMLEEGLDTLHLNLLPGGYVDADGNVTDDDLIGAWATRTTMYQGCPVTFEIQALDPIFHPMVIHDRRCAFTIRGCRPATSVYQEILRKSFKSEEKAQSSRRNIPMHLVNTNGPLGSYYTYGSERNSIFFDYSGREGNYRVLDKWDENRSGVLYKSPNANIWHCESKGLVPLDVNGSDCQRHLRKVYAQGNAAGYENVVYASWSRPARIFTDGVTKGEFPPVASIMGEGIVKITVFGDSTANNAILDGLASKPLLDRGGIEYQWQMPSFDFSKFPFDLANNQLSDIRAEYFARAFNLRCIQDMTGDGVEEIVMNVADKIAVFDGVTLCCLHERTFADEGSYIGTPNLRFDVADVNGDGYEDIVLLLNNTDGIGSLQIYSQGLIDEAPIFTKVIASSCLFCDVKAGHMSGNNLPEIAVLTRGLQTGSNTQLTKEGYLYMIRLEYDDGGNLTEKTVLGKTMCEVFGIDEALFHHVGNMDLVFGYFRGRDNYPDLVVGDSYFRYDPLQNKPVRQGSLLSNIDLLKYGDVYAFYSIPADAIMAVQTIEDYKESLVFYLNYIQRMNSNGFSGNTYFSQAEFNEIWFEADGTTVRTRGDFNEKYFGWNNSGNPELFRYLCLSYDNKPRESDYTYYMEDGDEHNSHPVLCKFVDREQSKHFRFLEHEVTFSEPRVYAALAAAPYYEDLTGSDNASTTWGKSSSDGTGTANSNTWGGSVIVGFNYSWSAPFLSAMNAGLEFTNKVGASASKATDHEDVTTYSVYYSTTQNHVVVLEAMPYDTYHYEITGSDDPDEIGLTFQVSIPRERMMTAMALEDYVRLTASQKGVGRPQDHLTSTPGKPFTYPESYDNAPRIIRDNPDYPFLTAQGLNNNSYETIGTGGAIVTRSIELESNTTHTNGVEISEETELVGTLMGIKAGIGFNYNFTHETSHIIGEGSSVEGSVAGLPNGIDDESQYPRFKWNLVWYYVKDANGEIYPVVNYIVTR